MSEPVKVQGIGADGISVSGCPPESIDGAVAVTVLLTALAAAEPGEPEAPGPEPAPWAGRNSQVSWLGRPTPSWRPVL